MLDIYKKIRFKNSKILRIDILDLFTYRTRFLVKLLFFNIWDSEDFISDVRAKLRYIKNEREVKSLFNKAFNDPICEKFSMFRFSIKTKNRDIYYLLNLRHFSKFLYKFARYRELSFVCQFVFNKLRSLNYKDSYYMGSHNKYYNYAVDPIIRKFGASSFHEETRKPREVLCRYVFGVLFKKKSTTKIIRSKMVRSLMNIIFFYNNIFSFGRRPAPGYVALINITLFLRRTYLERYKCIKNLIWITLSSNKRFHLDNNWYSINFNKKNNINFFAITYIRNKAYFLKFKDFLYKYYKKGFALKRCRIRLTQWCAQFFFFFRRHIINPFPLGKSYFIKFINYLIYCFLLYMTACYSYFKFFFVHFEVLKERFNFNGLPGVVQIRNLIYKLRPQKKVEAVKRGKWFNDTAFQLKKKYRQYKVWKLWNDYNHFSTNDEELDFKAFFKWNKTFYNYYKLFFKVLPKVSHKKNCVKKLFILLETRIDMLLYRLGYSNDLYFLRISIKKGLFLVEDYKVSFIGYYVPQNSLVQPTIKAGINIIRQMHLFYQKNIRNKQLDKPWYKSKIYYLGYLEFDLLRFAFVLIRFPKYDEITYMNSYDNKFTKQRFPLFEGVKAKSSTFSRITYSRLARVF